MIYSPAILGGVGGYCTEASLPHLPILPSCSDQHTPESNHVCIHENRRPSFDEGKQSCAEGKVALHRGVRWGKMRGSLLLSYTTDVAMTCNAFCCVWPSVTD
jgi:hypothetical protein